MILNKSKKTKEYLNVNLYIIIAYGSWSGLGGGPACGLCYALTVYGSYDGQADPALFPKCSLVVRITDQCPYPDNKEWCPGPEQPESGK